MSPQAFLTAAREFEIDTASFSVGLDPTQESIQRSVAALGASSYRAVVVFLYTQDAVSFTQAVADGYLGQRSAKDMILTWHLAGGMEVRPSNCMQVMASLRVLCPRRRHSHFGWRLCVLRVKDATVEAILVCGNSHHLRLACRVQ